MEGPGTQCDTQPALKEPEGNETLPQTPTTQGRQFGNSVMWAVHVLPKNSGKGLPSGWSEQDHHESGHSSKACTDVSV